MKDNNVVVRLRVIDNLCRQLPDDFYNHQELIETIHRRIDNYQPARKLYDAYKTMISWKMDEHIKSGLITANNITNDNATIIAIRLGLYSLVNQYLVNEHELEIQDTIINMTSDEITAHFVLTQLEKTKV